MTQTTQGPLELDPGHVAAPGGVAVQARLGADLLVGGLAQGVGLDRGEEHLQMIGGIHGKYPSDFLMVTNFAYPN